MSVVPKIWNEGPYGMIEGEPNDVYHANAALSKSKLDVFIESPLLFFKTYIAKNLLQKDGDEKEKRWAVIGNALHARLLEGETAYLARFAVAPEFGPCRKTDTVSTEEAKANKTRRDAWRAENFGKSELTAYESKQIDAMTVAARSVPAIRELLVRIKPEVTWRVNDGEIDLQCRCDGFIESADEALVALLNREAVIPEQFQVGDAIVIDLKTVASFSGSDFQNWDKAVWNLGYHRAVAFYRGVMRSVRPFLRLHWLFVAVEKDEPFRAGIYALDEPSLVRGWDETVHHLRRFKDCVHLGKWPGLSSGVQVISLPEWYLKRDIA